jgi:hypothetical protein
VALDLVIPLNSYFLLDSQLLTDLKVEKFVDEECIPAYTLFEAQLGHGESRWATKPAILEKLIQKARKLGLWNMFLSQGHDAGFSNVEYALMAEYLGKSPIASEVCYGAIYHLEQLLITPGSYRQQIIRLLILVIWSFCSNTGPKHKSNNGCIH